MSHFNFSLDDLADPASLTTAVLGNQTNFTPDGQSKALSTTWRKGSDTPQQSLTTLSVSDIMQGAATYKPQELTYNSFNQVLSMDLGAVKNSQIGGERPKFSEAQLGLMGYDTFGIQGLDFGGMVSNAQGALQGSQNGSGQPASGGTITDGNPPPDIPRGPFPLRILRTSNTNAVKSDVEPITLTGDQILRLLLSAGCPIEGAVFLWALSMRESHFVTNVAGINNNGTIDVGLWQLNEVNWKSRGKTAEDATDPWINVSITMEISNNGTNFVPWQTSGNYSSPDGSHLKSVNMEEARNFFREAGYQV